MRPVTTRNVFIALLVAWLTAVLIGFYAVQKPFDLTQAQAMAQLLWNIAVSLLMLGAATRLGLWLLRTFSLPALTTGERWLFAVTMGLGGLAMLSLIMGAVGLLHPVLLVMLLLGLNLALVQRRGELRDLWHAVGREWAACPRPMQVFLGTTWGLSLLLALAPPISFDALLYHLTVPKLYIQAGRIVSGIDISSAYFPSLVETLYLGSLALHADVSAKLLHFAYGLLLAAGVYLSGLHYWGRRVGRWSVTLLFSMPMVSLLMSWAYNDLALALYSLLALYALARWREDRGQWWILSATMAGCALGMKYTAFVVPLTLGTLLLLWGRRTPRNALSYMIRLGLATGLVALPWYAKSWFLSGNPVYPFLFGGKFWDSFRMAAYRQAGTGIGWDPRALLALPWVTTMGYRDTTFWDGRTGPLLLVLFPAVVALRFWPGLLPRRETAQRFVDTLLLFAALSFGFWTFGVVNSSGLWQARLLLPALVALSLVSAWALHELGCLDLPAFSLRRFLMMAIALVLGLQMISQAIFLLNNNPLPYLAGLETRDSYLQRNLGTHYQAMQAIGRDTPAGARVLFLYEPRSYYSPRPTQPDALLDNFGDALYHYDTPQQITKRWREVPYTHVLIYWWGVHFLEQNKPNQLDSATQAALQTLVQDDLREIYRDQRGDYALYAIAGSE